jgi:dihydrofolate reductase
VRKVIVHEFISLDGVIQAPGGREEDTDGGFQHGGWTIPYWDHEIGATFDRTMQDADALLLGRKTWQIHSVFETMEGDPFADALNAVPKYVVSTTLTNTDAWRNSTLINGNVVDEVRKLKQDSGANILMDGSSILAHTLFENDLIDELHLHVYPLALGGGKRLFPDTKRVNLRLVESRPLSTGVVYVHYVRE